MSNWDITVFLFSALNIFIFYWNRLLVTFSFIVDSIWSEASKYCHQWGTSFSWVFLMLWLWFIIPSLMSLWLLWWPPTGSSIFMVVVMLLIYSVLHCLYSVGNKIITTTTIPPRFDGVKRGIYWFHVIHPSVRLSVRLWTKPCPLCNFHNTSRIHFIFVHVIRQLQKVCRV